jgi:hypothetical protein
MHPIRNDNKNIKNKIIIIKIDIRREKYLHPFSNMELIIWYEHKYEL